MKIIGVVARPYYNKDNQKMYQIHEQTRRLLTKYEDVICLPLIPQEDINYLDIEVGKDLINMEKLDDLLDMCDGFILPGGTYSYNFDEYIMKHSIERDKPLLSICLGFQALCSLYAKERSKFDMTSKVGNESHYGKATDYIHNVRILQNTRLYELLNSQIVPVNSVHHDKVDFEMNELVINAISEDGIIEGIEYPNKNFIIGVQWHPEYLNDIYSERLINAYMESIELSKKKQKRRLR